MYYVVCNYGTRKFVWTRKAALEWLQACGPVAVVGNSFTGKVVFQRVQREITAKLAA